MDVFKFAPNRVWRVYRGGRGIDQMRGAPEPADGFFPEDWVASDTLAVNPENFGGHDGVSLARVDGREERFDHLLARRGAELLGTGHIKRYGPRLGFLTKILDSAIRLPLQAHPDRATARRLFDSPYGKTEAWVILGTRDAESYLIVGFNEKLDEAVFRREADAGDMPESLKMVHYHAVRPGDVLLIPGGLVHAIGPGVTLIEIMEPTDWVVQPEAYCGDFKIPEIGRYGREGADPQAMLDVFDFRSSGKDGAWNSCALEPRPLSREGGLEMTWLVEREKVRYFGALRARLDGAWSGEWSLGAAAGIVTDGSARINGLSLRRGDTFFIPHSAPPLRMEGAAEIVFSLPPRDGD